MLAPFSRMEPFVKFRKSISQRKVLSGFVVVRNFVIARSLSKRRGNLRIIKTNQYYFYILSLEWE